MKKKVLCLTLALLLMLSVVACSNGGDKESTAPPESSAPTEPPTQATEPPETTAPTEPEPTLPPEGKLPCEQPWCEELEFIRSIEREYEFVEAQSKDAGGQRFLYTGESNVVDIPGLDFTLTLPEEWMDRIEVIVCRVGWVDDGAGSVARVCVLNKELGKQYANHWLGEDGQAEYEKPENSDILFTARMADPILSVAVYDEEALASNADAQRKLAGGYLLDGGSKNGKHYILISTQLGEPQDDQPMLTRFELICDIGQEAYDEVVGDLFCTPEQAFEIFKLR